MHSGVHCHRNLYCIAVGQALVSSMIVVGNMIDLRQHTINQTLTHDLVKNATFVTSSWIIRTRQFYIAYEEFEVAFVHSNVVLLWDGLYIKIPRNGKEYVKEVCPKVRNSIG